MSKFNFLSKLNFIQALISKFISFLNPILIHNLGKYMALKKAFYLSSLDQTQGDYFEFGVFTGSSFCHAINCAKRSTVYDPKLKDIMFYGFDSFEGFGPLEEKEKHPFYTDINFKVNYNDVYKRINKCINENQFRLVKGYFKDSLQNQPNSSLARIVFIDCDIYNASKDALNYISKIVQIGTIIILDDYFSYKGSENKGVYAAFNEFKKENKLTTRTLFYYGMGGIATIVSSIN